MMSSLHPLSTEHCLFSWCSVFSVISFCLVSFSSGKALHKNQSIFHIFSWSLNLLVHKPQVQLFVRIPLPTPLRHQNKTIFQRFLSNIHFVQWMESCTEVREYISELLSFLKIFVSYCNIMEMTCLSVFNRQSYSQANTFGKKKWSL